MLPAVAKPGLLVHLDEVRRLHSGFSWHEVISAAPAAEL